MNRSPFLVGDQIPPFIPLVDDWIEAGIPEEDKIFRPVNNFLYAPITKCLALSPDYEFNDRFDMTIKRAYAKESGMILHFSEYLNYFEKFFDPEKELLGVYANIKIKIDSVDFQYPIDQFEYDLRRLIIFSPTIREKLRRMNTLNFISDIKEYRNDNRGLAFTSYHSVLLMELSILQVMIIPLISHFGSVLKKRYKRIFSEIDYLMYFFAIILKEVHPEVDLVGKLTESVIEAFRKSEKKDEVLWAKQAIRGHNLESYANKFLKENMISAIIPKYVYRRSNIAFNQVSIRDHIRFAINDGKYEYELKELNHDNYDEDNNSDLDKFEAHLSKKNEALFLHNRVNYEQVMISIENRFGPFSNEEIDYYLRELTRDKANPVNELQKELIFNLFYKFFGDTAVIKSIDIRDYIKLLLAAKRLLHSYRLFNMEAIVSGKVVKLINRGNINMKEQAKIKASNLYKMLENKYKNQKILDQCLALLATIGSSKFQVIDFHHQELTGQPIFIKPDMLNQEFLEYVTMV